jgi:hypothetical protein
MNNIPAVNGVPYVNNAEFVKLSLSTSTGNVEVLTYSTSYKSENIGGTVYSPLGGYLGVSTQQRDLSATGYDTTITLSGVDQTNIFYVLSDQYLIKGSKIEFYRGFYNENYNLTSTVLRYTGIVTSYTIEENLDLDSKVDNYTVSVNCSSYKTVLQNLISGRYTNPSSWSQYGPSDKSMDNVPNLINAYFNFGQKA